MLQAWDFRSSFIVFVAVVMAFLAASRAEAAPSELSAAMPEAVVMLLGGQLSDRRLPAFLEVQPGRLVASSTILRACRTPSVRADSVLMFFLNTQRCEQVTVAAKITLPQRLQTITGRFAPPDLLQRLQLQPFVTLAAAPKSPPLRGAECTCPENTPPEGTLGCAGQTRTAGAPIASIDYFAIDADDDPLSGVFTHRRGSNPIQNGLPSPLLSSCTADPGILQCTITGSAPAQAGEFQLMLAVSDGAAILDLASVLDVTAANDDLIFLDQFETPFCL